MEHEHLTINWIHLVAGYVNFALLIVVLRILLRKPLNNYLKGRRAEIAEEIELSSKMKAQAEARYAEYQAKVQNLDSDLKRIKAEMTEAGRAERDRILAMAEEKASLMRKETVFLIEQQRRQLRNELTDQTAESVAAGAHELLKKNTTHADQMRLADEFLKDIKNWYEQLKKGSEGSRGGPRGGSVRPPSTQAPASSAPSGSRSPSYSVGAAEGSRS